MTLTIIDGDFPRETLADENLTFDDFEMPAANMASFAHVSRSDSVRLNTSRSGDDSGSRQK